MVVSSSLSQGRRGVLGHEQPPGLVVLSPSPSPSPTGMVGHSWTLLCTFQEKQQQRVLPQGVGVFVPSGGSGAAHVLAKGGTCGLPPPPAPASGIRTSSHFPLRPRWQLRPGLRAPTRALERLS